MCCITLTVLEATMATTQFARAASHEVRTPWLPQQTPSQQPLRMNWVVVSDESGNQQLRMSWNAVPETLETVSALVANSAVRTYRPRSSRNRGAAKRTGVTVL